MSCKYVVGNGLTLDWAMAAWRECAPALDVQAVAVDPQAGRDAIAAVLDTLTGEGASAFVAIDAQHLNFHRLHWVDALRQRGLPMPPLLGRGALVADGVDIGENCWIGAGAVLEPGSSVAGNVVIGARAIVGAGASVAQSCWIDAGVVVGREAKLGAHVTLGLGVLVGHRVRIADHCVIDRAGRIDHDLAGRTFVYASHDGPIVIAGE